MSPFAPRGILAATDFSEIATYALRHAVTWAQRCGARLMVIHAHEVPILLAHPHCSGYDLADLLETARASAEECLTQHVQAHVPPDISVSLEVVAGTPATVIEEYAERGGADLVVIGTHGRGGISRLLLGSVAERVLRRAPQPTLIVRPRAQEQAPDTPRVTHILCPVNYSEVARVAFQHACTVARTFGARLTVLFAIEEKPVTPPLIVHAEHRLKSWLPAEPEVECQMQPVVRHGDAAEQAITLAREAAVDLVVIGAQHRRFVDTTVLGTTTVRVTRHAPCPVLVVPRSEGSE
jgi:nucleotide-binding universal stress UspA family protein